MKKKVLGLFSALLIAFMVTLNVNALEIVNAGETVVEEGEFNSTRLVAGNKVTDKSKVDGISFVAGNDITLEGSAPYGFYAGNIVTVNKEIERDLFIAGNSINIGSDAKIGRDLFIAGNTIKINANIERDIRVGGTSVDLSGITIGGDAYIDASEIVMDENTTITGKLTYYKDAKVTGLEKAKIGTVETKEFDEVVIEYSFMDRVYSFIIRVFAAFVVLIVLFYMLPKSKEKLDNIDLSFDNIAKTTGMGLVTLVIVPFISLITLFTGILTPLALIAIAIYAISIYIASILVYYIVGKELTKKICKNENKYLAIIIGIVLVKLIKLIPAFGGLLAALLLFYGMGLIYKFISTKGE